MHFAFLYLKVLEEKIEIKDPGFFLRSEVDIKVTLSVSEAFPPTTPNPMLEQCRVEEVSEAVNHPHIAALIEHTGPLSTAEASHPCTQSGL